MRIEIEVMQNEDMCMDLLSKFSRTEKMNKYTPGVEDNPQTIKTRRRAV